MAEEQFDLAVIGAGPGGYVAAIRAAQLGLRTVLIEKDKPGGVCLNIGCIPTKALLHQAELARSIPALEALGYAVSAAGFDYAKAWRKSRDVAARLSRGVQGLLKKNKVELIAGHGSLAAPGVVEVAAGGQSRLVAAKSILLATGSRPRGIPGYEFDGETVLSSDEVLMLERLPASLAILGAGAIGVEIASIMASFGVKVSLIEAADRILPRMDADAAKLVEAELRRLGVAVHAGCQAGALDYSDGGVSLELTAADGAGLAVEAEKLLVAVGRSPNSEKLGLEKAGVATARGCVVVGDHYQTNVPGVYAVGDLIDSPQLAHLASKEGEIAVAHAAGRPGEAVVDADEVPFAVYSQPEVASFGPGEAEAKARGIDCKAFSFPFLGVGKSIAVEEPAGFVKIVAAGNRVLGATVAGKNATELVHELLLAKRAGVGVDRIAETIHAHPTLSEGVMEAARGIEGWAIHI